MDALKEKIKQEIKHDILNLEDSDLSWIKARLVEPRIKSFRTMTGDVAELWIVADRITEDDDGYMIVYDPGTEKFGIATAARDEFDFYMGPYGTFSEAVKGL